MYFAFGNDFLKQWNDPTEVEKLRKAEEEEKERNTTTRFNMDLLEKCIKKHSIDELDRTKTYDKTFICDNFISEYGSYIYDNDFYAKGMNEFTQEIKPEIKKLNIDYVGNTPKIDTFKWDDINRYSFKSNFIPKNTFTNISTFLVFRISNTSTEESPKRMEVEKSCKNLYDFEDK